MITSQEQHHFIKASIWTPVHCIGCNKYLVGLQVICSICHQFAHTSCAQWCCLPPCTTINLVGQPSVINNEDFQQIAKSFITEQFFKEPVDLEVQKTNFEEKEGIFILSDSWLYVGYTQVEDVPSEVWHLVLSYCGYVDLCRVARVCKYLGKISSSNALWDLMIHKSGYGGSFEPTLVTNYKLFYQLLLIPYRCVHCHQTVIPIIDCLNPRCSAHSGTVTLKQGEVNDENLFLEVALITGPLALAKAVWTCCGKDSKEKECKWNFHETDLKNVNFYIPVALKKKLMETVEVGAVVVNIGKVMVGLPLLIGCNLVGVGIRAGAEFLIYRDPSKYE